MAARLSGRSNLWLRDRDVPRGEVDTSMRMPPLGAMTWRTQRLAVTIRAVLEQIAVGSMGTTSLADLNRAERSPSGAKMRARTNSVYGIPEARSTTMPRSGKAFV